MAEEERAALVDHLARDPLAGDVIPDTGGLRKLRWARPGSGRRDGYRTIYYYFDASAPIYAIYVYGKNQQADLSPDQRKRATKLASEIKATIRTGRGKGRSHE